MPKVILKGHIIVPDADLNAVEEALPEHINLSRMENGCLVFRVVRYEHDITVFHVHEEFKDRESFEAISYAQANPAGGRIE